MSEQTSMLDTLAFYCSSLSGDLWAAESPKDKESILQNYLAKVDKEFTTVADFKSGSVLYTFQDILLYLFLLCRSRVVQCHGTTAIEILKGKNRYFGLFHLLLYQLFAHPPGPEALREAVPCGQRCRHHWSSFSQI